MALLRSLFQDPCPVGQPDSIDRGSGGSLERAQRVVTGVPQEQLGHSAAFTAVALALPCERDGSYFESS